MKNLISIMSLLIIISSCGVPFGKDFKKAKKGSSRQFSTTNSKFDSIINQFEQDGRIYKKNNNFNSGNIPINFGDTENPKFDGVCIIYSNGQREIIIKKAWWDVADKTQRKILIYHELGHCSLDREHDESTIIVNKRVYKLSIMNSVIPGNSSLKNVDRQIGYLDELYNKTKVKLTTTINLLKK